MNRDPIGEAGGVNLYVLCKNKYGLYDQLGLTEPSSFLNGIKDPEIAKKLIEEHFSDTQRRIDEFRRWCKQNGYRKSSLLKTTRFSKKASLSGIVKGVRRCSSILLIFEVIFTPLDAGAEPLIIDGQFLDDMIKDRPILQNGETTITTEVIDFEKDGLGFPFFYPERLKTLWEWL